MVQCRQRQFSGGKCNRKDHGLFSIHGWASSWLMKEDITYAMPCLSCWDLAEPQIENRPEVVIGLLVQAKTKQLGHIRTGFILMGECKKDETPLLTHWSYVFLALTHRSCLIYKYIDGLAQEGRNSRALAMKLCLSCINLSSSTHTRHPIVHPSGQDMWSFLWVQCLIYVF